MSMPEIQIHTIGFTKKSAEHFFEMIRRSCVKRVVDVRLNNVSQLAGFSKKDDLQYFLKLVCFFLKKGGGKTFFPVKLTHG